MLDKSIVATKIKYQALAALFLPIVLPLICFLVLFQLMSNFEHTAQEEERQARFNEMVETEIMLGLNTMGSAVTYVISGDQFSHAESIKQYNFAKSHLQKMTAMAGDDPRLLQQMEVFRQQLEENRMLIESAGTLSMGETDSFAAYSEVIKNIKKFKRFLRTMFSADQHADFLIRESQEHLEKMREGQHQSNENNKYFVVGCLVVYLIVALSAVLWLARNITGRLDILVGNAQKLPRGMPLEERVSGLDELAYLDTVLHEADTYLREAKEQRGLLMEMVAHDMRSPLMSAQIALDLLGNVITDPSEMVNRQTNALRRNLSVVINLVNDLLTIDRLEAGAMELETQACEAHQLVADAIIGVAALAVAKGITLVNSCPTGVHVLADQDRIVQVLTNLITNAIKFSPKGSTITVSGELADLFVRLCVADQGPGLPAGMETRVFEKYQQVEKEHAKRGYGLGLTICKMLVELHGGTIRAQSQPEGGSRFCFSLPQCRPPAPAKVSDQKDSQET